MKWNELTELQQLEEIKAISSQQKVLIFKHSTTCGVSRGILKALERDWDEAEMAHIQPYFLDLKTYREVSNKIAEMFGVVHQSPQVLLIEGEQAIYNASHGMIDYDTLKGVAQ
jgi:bacillithiol system protein YtxJ